MDETGDDFEYANARLPGRLYVSKRFRYKSDGPDFRLGHRAFPSDDLRVLMKELDQVILRTTGKGVQQVRAKFLEDDRRIQTLWFQRWNVEKGWPIGHQQITLIGSEIPRLIEFLNSIARVHIPGDVSQARDCLCDAHWDELVLLVVV